MGTGRNAKPGARQGGPSSLNPPRNPNRRQPSARPDPTPQPSNFDDACYQLLEARSIFVCAACCLDEIVDVHELDAADHCHPQDVAVIVRLGIVKLRKVQEALEVTSAEGMP